MKTGITQNIIHMETNKKLLADSLGYSVMITDSIFKIANTNTYVFINDKLIVTPIIKDER